VAPLLVPKLVDNFLNHYKEDILKKRQNDEYINASICKTVFKDALNKLHVSALDKQGEDCGCDDANAAIILLDGARVRSKEATSLAYVTSTLADSFEASVSTDRAQSSRQ
jgi:hypothetical protein